MPKTSKRPLPEIDLWSLAPPQKGWAHAVINQFLRGALLRVDDALEAHRAQAMTDRTDRLRGLIEYYRHQQSCLKDLIAQNHGAYHAKRPRKPR